MSSAGSSSAFSASASASSSSSIISPSSSLSLEEVVDRIAVMRRQEESCYAYRHYLPTSPTPSSNSSSCCGKKLTTAAARINVTWREKIVTWTYNVVDHFDLSREVVAVSLSLFDRYMAIACHNQCHNGNLALLCSLTTLQIAIKLHHPQKLERDIRLESLSRGQFDQEDIARMEWTILSALQWRLHAPTPCAFMEHYLHLLPSATTTAADPTSRTGSSSSLRKDLMDLSRYLSELAVCDSYFCPVLNSTIALAAILNVMDEMSYAYFPAALRQEFRRNLTKYGGGGGSGGASGLSCQSPAVLAARERLSAMFTSTNDATTTMTTTVTPESSPLPPVSSTHCSVEGNTSPPSVIAEIHHQHDDCGRISSPSDLASLSSSFESASEYSNGSYSFYSKNAWSASSSSSQSHHSDAGNTSRQQDAGCGDGASCSSYRYSPFSPSIRRPYHQQHSGGSCCSNTKHIVSPCVAITSTTTTTTHSMTASRSSRHSSPIVAGFQ